MDSNNISIQEVTNFLLCMCNPDHNNYYSFNLTKLLYSAIDSNSISIIKIIFGLNPDLVNGNTSKSPLYVASSKGKREIVSFLIAKGINVNKRTIGGRTPIYAAALNGHKEIVQMLLDANADCNIVAFTGRNALFAAISKNHIDIMKLLISHGANTDFLYSYALQNNKFDVIKTLILYGNVDPYDVYVTNLSTTNNIKNLLLHYKQAAKFIANWAFEQLYKPGGIMVRKEKKKFEKCLEEMDKNKIV